MTGTVLVADDSPTIQKKASGILTGEGLDVVTVSNGVAAIKKMSTVKPQIVLADCSMPGKDGYEVCEYVKSSPELGRVPVLLIVSDLEPYDDERGMRVRADGRITKPFNPEDLISAVSSFLNKAASEAAAAAEPPPPPELPPPPTPEFSVGPVLEMDDPSMAARAETRVSGVPQDVAFSEPLPEEHTVRAEELHAEEGVPLTETPMEDVASYPPELELTPEPLLEPTQASTGAGEVALEAGQEVPSIFTYDLEPPHPTAEPVLIEEPITAEPVPPQSRPHAERTMSFRSPLHIAEPSLHDELATPEPAIAPPTVEPVVETPEPTLSASTLESYSLDEAAAGHVHFATRMETPVEAAEYTAAPAVESAPGESGGEPFAEAPSELSTPPVDEHPLMVEEAPAAETVEPAIETVEPPAAGG